MQLAKSGAVRKLTVNGHTANAEVKSSQLYRVQLNSGQTLLSYCTCPAAEYQEMCKHGAAVAYCLLSDSPIDQDSCCSRVY
ncbi:SWIM zinc finger family protein [Vibrio metschnikovii]|uniref:SWIM zinc finger family protein n=1 Tax=Vibrio metschnikovii TaxID=28172 RepID=UPI001C30C645|nr:SWIM zinc finger family protein [Vibrio metschnikovii]